MAQPTFCTSQLTPEPAQDWRHPVGLSFTEFGKPSGRAVILLNGLGMRMIEWPQSLLAQLSTRFRVICIENRDVGLSPRCGPDSEPGFVRVWQDTDEDRARQLAPYSLFDMRDDVLSLLDRLKIKAFDLIGFSMGGMIAQMVAAKAGVQVGTFVQLSSNDGTQHLHGTQDALARIARLFTRPASPDQTQAYFRDDLRFYSAGRLAVPETPLSKLAQGYSHGGSARQAIAILSSGDRRAELHKIQARTLILHGDLDPCISPYSGQAAADQIPNAKFKLLKGVGHVLDAQMCDATLEGLRCTP